MEGSTTAKANAVATAASTALPPASKMSRPISVASGAPLTTMPRDERPICEGP